MAGYPQFLYHGWKEHKLEIRFHTTLTPKNWEKVMIFASKLKKCKFYWWRHNIFCSIKIISLLAHWLSPKFWYAIAETILYRSCIHCFSFLWRHHGENLDFRRHVNIFRVYVLSLWELIFFSNHELTWQSFGSCNSLIFAPFALRFWYVIVEKIISRKCSIFIPIRCWHHTIIFGWRLNLDMDSDHFLVSRVIVYGKDCSWMDKASVWQ